MDELHIQIPKDVENLSLPSPELITYYRNLEKRIIWLDTDVDDYCLEMSRLIMLWNAEDKGKAAEDREPIKFMICSYGGDLDINNSIVDLIQTSKTPVYGYNMGYACSSGCFIYMACHKRFSMPNAYFLIHKGSGGFSGTYDQVSAEMEEYERKIGVLAQFILKHTSIDVETLEQNLGGEWYLSADDALKYGVCDAIISDIDEVI